MSWRREKGEDWDSVKGATNKSRFKKLVASGKAHGVVAFVDGAPVGWVSFDRRSDFQKIDRSPSLKCDDAERVWSVPCFFVHKDYRGKGVATAMLAHAVRAMEKQGAEIIEGYPVKPGNFGKKIPHAFAWTGTVSLFKDAGFKAVGKKDGGRQRVRREA